MMYTLSMYSISDLIVQNGSSCHIIKLWHQFNILDIPLIKGTKIPHTLYTFFPD